MTMVQALLFKNGAKLNIAAVAFAVLLVSLLSGSSDSSNSNVSAFTPTTPTINNANIGNKNSRILSFVSQRQHQQHQRQHQSFIIFNKKKNISCRPTSSFSTNNGNTLLSMTMTSSPSGIDQLYLNWYKLVYLLHIIFHLS
jgi:hypothetical protein